MSYFKWVERRSLPSWQELNNNELVLGCVQSESPMFSSGIRYDDDDDPTKEDRSLLESKTINKVTSTVH